jgi:hypothetical protein
VVERDVNEQNEEACKRNGGLRYVLCERGREWREEQRARMEVLRGWGDVRMRG